MRIMLDNNVWSYLGDEQAGDRFKTVAHSLGHRVVTAPSVLLEVLQHPRSDIRAAIIEAITTATDERLRSEADREGAEVIFEVRRLHPEWMRAVPDTGREATWRTYWTKRFWREAVEHHERVCDTEPARRTARTVRSLVDNQEEQRERWREANFDLRDLSRVTLAPSEETPREVQAGWAPGERIAAWRPYSQEVYWHAFARGRRSVLTNEETTYADWVGARVDLRVMCASREAFNRFWLYEVEAAHMPRTWLRWAADTIQADVKVTDGNLIDVQHATYLPDCDVFLTADKNFLRVLDRIAEQAPVPLGRAHRVVPAAHTASWRQSKPRCAPYEVVSTRRPVGGQRFTQLIVVPRSFEVGAIRAQDVEPPDARVKARRRRRGSSFVAGTGDGALANGSGASESLSWRPSRCVRRRPGPRDPGNAGRRTHPHGPASLCGRSGLIAPDVPTAGGGFLAAEASRGRDVVDLDPGAVPQGVGRTADLVTPDDGLVGAGASVAQHVEGVAGVAA